MKLVSKKDLAFVQGRLVNINENEIVHIPGLVREVKDLVEMKELIEFCIENEDKINASAEPVYFEPTPAQAPKLSSNRQVATPVLDSLVAQMSAAAEEFLTTVNADEVNAHLAQYRVLARWFEDEYVTYDPNCMYDMRSDLPSNVLEWTEKDVIQLVEQFHNPDITKLISKVRICK